MTPQEPAFIELASSVKRIESALLGDAMNGKNGIIHYHDKMKEDLYGIGSNGDLIEGKNNTLLARVSSMEDKQKKAIWIFTGIGTVIVGAKIGLSALIDKIWSK